MLGPFQQHNMSQVRWLSRQLNAAVIKASLISFDSEIGQGQLCWQWNVHLNYDLSSGEIIILSLIIQGHSSVVGACAGQVSAQSRWRDPTFWSFWLLVTVLTLSCVSMLLTAKQVYRSIEVFQMAKERYSQLNTRRRSAAARPHQPPVLWEALSFSDKLRFFNMWIFVTIVQNTACIVGCVILLMPPEQWDLVHDWWANFLIAVAGMSTWVHITQYFEYDKELSVFLMALRTGFPFIMRLTVALGPVFTGYAIFGWTMFGAFAPVFDSFGRTAVTLFCILNGDDIHSTFRGMDVGEQAIGRIFLLSFCILFIYSVLNVFIYIMEDAVVHVKDKVMLKKSESWFTQQDQLLDDNLLEELLKPLEPPEHRPCRHRRPGGGAGGAGIAPHGDDAAGHSPDGELPHSNPTKDGRSGGGGVFYDVNHRGLYKRVLADGASGVCSKCEEEAIEAAEAAVDEAEAAWQRRRISYHNDVGHHGGLHEPLLHESFDERAEEEEDEEAGLDVEGGEVVDGPEAKVAAGGSSSRGGTHASDRGGSQHHAIPSVATGAGPGGGGGETSAGEEMMRRVLEHTFLIQERMAERHMGNFNAKLESLQREHLSMLERGHQEMMNAMEKSLRRIVAAAPPQPSHITASTQAGNGQRSPRSWMSNAPHFAPAVTGGGGAFNGSPGSDTGSARSGGSGGQFSWRKLRASLSLAAFAAKATADTGSSGYTSIASGRAPGNVPGRSQSVNESSSGYAGKAHGLGVRSVTPLRVGSEVAADSSSSAAGDGARDATSASGSAQHRRTPGRSHSLGPNFGKAKVDTLLASPDVGVVPHQEQRRRSRQSDDAQGDTTMGDAALPSVDVALIMP
eukprot:jgi/Mesvir1/8177/Mv12479-RA.3